MAASDGHIEFDDGAGTTIDVRIASFPYKTVIELPFEWQKQDDGTWEGYDHGDTYDKRSCVCSFFYSVADMATFNDFFRTTGEGRGQDVIMRMSAGSGFFPFGPDKGDVGDFTVALTIKKPGTVGESPFRYFKFDAIIHNTGAWPVYALPTEVAEGVFDIGTITDLRFPPNWFKPKVQYGEFVTIEQNASSQWMDRSDNADWYESNFNMVCNESKAAALIEYLVDTARVNSFNITPPDNSYMWGRDYDNDLSFTVQCIQDKITITQTQFNRFTFGLNFAFGTSFESDIGTLTFVETQDPSGGDGLCAAMDSDYLVMFYGMNGTNNTLRTYTYTVAGNATLVDAYPGVGGTDTAYQIALDATKTPRLVFYSSGSDFLCLAYDSSGNLTHKSTQAAVTFVRGLTLDTSRNFAFVGNSGNIESFPYTDLGVIGAEINSDTLAGGNFVCLAVDPVWRIVFGGSTNTKGLYACTYDTDGDNLTIGAAINAFDYSDGWVAVDSTNKRLFSASDEGLHMYSYDSTGATTLLDSDITIANGGGVSIDIASRIIFFSAWGDGVKAFNYKDLTTLVVVGSFDDQGGNYFGNAVDATNNVLACTAETAGFHMYTYI